MAKVETKMKERTLSSSTVKPDGFDQAFIELSSALEGFFDEPPSDLEKENGRPVEGSIVLTNGVESVPKEQKKERKGEESSSRKDKSNHDINMDNGNKSTEGDKKESEPRMKGDELKEKESTSEKREDTLKKGKGEPKDEDKDDPKEKETKEDELEPNKTGEDGEKSTVSPPTKGPSSGDSGPEITSNEATPSDPPKLDAPDAPKFLDEPSDSLSQREWKRQKRDGARNEAIDKVMDLVGQENVKSHVLKVKGMVDTARRQGVDLSKDRFSVAFVGNSGKENTTISGLYAQFLLSMEIVLGKEVLETKAKKVAASDDIASTTKLLKELGEGKGGIYVVDETHHLVSNKANFDHIVGEIDTHQGRIIFIFAGYVEGMGPFLKHIPNGQSRVPHTIRLDDHLEKELLHYLAQLIETRFHKKMEVEGGIYGQYSQILVRRLISEKKADEAAATQAVEGTFRLVCERQAERLRLERIEGKAPEDFFLAKEDMIGPEPTDALERSAAWKELQALIGLEEVKVAIKSLSNRTQDNYNRVLQGKEPLSLGLNRVFHGNPGTGKTTVAKLYGQVLVDLGLLSSGEVTIKTPADLIARYTGQTESNTTSILAAAMGRVLIIDEFHMLYQGKKSSSSSIASSFQIAAIDTIVSQTQNKEDRCIILAGYTEPILEIFQNLNPGLARRFPLEDAINFADFTIAQLTQILDKMVRDQGLEMTEMARKVAIQMLQLAQDRPNFGNGGEVANMIDRAKASRRKRHLLTPPINPSDSGTLRPEDFDANFERVLSKGNSCRELFRDVIGCENIISQFENYQLIAEGMRKHGVDPRPHIPFTFIFKGPPGTDMIGEYLGQTGPKIINLFERALGKVLFIDEAYRLGKSEYTKDAAAELVDCITKKRYANKLIIILAGYEVDMNNLLQANRGLASRFPTELIFRHMPPEDCWSC
ncbi:P-loop containing nucleoside triphosphate hydrolase protein [Acephala macrosclerotiorum]|nr:P-loop containing nucleoside triphosphate hydrolase protein [Acephala macrosclerotiorum]